MTKDEKWMVYVTRLSGNRFRVEFTPDTVMYFREENLPDAIKYAIASRGEKIYNFDSIVNSPLPSGDSIEIEFSVEEAKKIMREVGVGVK